MAGGYSTPAGDSVAPLVATIKDVRRQLRDAQRPQGTNLTGLVSQVQALLVQVQDALVNIQQTVETTTDDYLSGGTVAMGTVNASGDVTATNVAATGQGTFPAGVNSVGVYNALLPSSYRVQYIMNTGDMGYVPSSRRFKQDIATAPDVKSAMLAMRVVTFRYDAAVQEQGEDAAIEWGVIAEEIHGLGIYWAVDYDENGLPFGIKYERLVLACIPVIQDHEDRLNAAGL